MADTVNPAEHGAQENDHQYCPLNGVIASKRRQFVHAIGGDHQHAKCQRLRSREILDGSVHRDSNSMSRQSGTGVEMGWCIAIIIADSPYLDKNPELEAQIQKDQGHCHDWARL